MPVVTAKHGANHGKRAKRAKPKAAYKRLTAAKARQLFDYFPATGVVRWKVDRICGTGRVRMKAGDRAGAPRKCGYRYVCVDRLQIMEHVLIWLLVKGRYPTHMIDHENRDGFDNRWDNIRNATRAQNQHNTLARRTNLSGLKGVRSHKSGKFQASIMAHLGTYRTAEGAHAAYKRAARLLHKEFANTGSRSAGPGARL
jgi:hypothetical protein